MKRLLPSVAAAALISAAAAGLMLGKAAAADLALEAPPVVAPLPVPHDWTGAYIGLHAGYGWAGIEAGGDVFDDLDIDRVTDADLDGGLIGAQIGYNYQWNWFVLGVEADATWSFIGTDDDLLDDDDDDFNRLGLNADIDWLASIRARAGVAFDRVMVYGTGGVAFTEFDTSADFDFVNVDVNVDSGAQTGWVLGVGAEWQAWRSNTRGDNVTVGVEYLHYEFGDVADVSLRNVDLGIDGNIGGIDGNIDVVRARLNWKFGSLFGG